MRHTPLGKLFKEESVQCCSGRADLKKCRPLPDMKGTYEGENETYIEASVENSSSILYDKEIRNKPRTRRTKRNV